MGGERRPRILWGLSASVAAIRAPNLARALAAVGDLRAIATERAGHFLEDWPVDVPLLRDADEWAAWKRLGDPVLHIELRRWADVFVIAPLSADALAKLAGGICDNLLLSTARAWDYSRPLLVAPAMNTLMWEHPATREHLETLRRWGARVVPPVEKELACADVGMGALASPETIAADVAAALAAGQSRASSSNERYRSST